ncbi:hypothetical protein BD310DRAFT_941299 [Dichomitus squalens]|uniref:Uncharacterized protein n=1 Tax=Dichomitus squalens TaxID=114155 RepID=A0A4Q9PH04_9APHY|nr:hypothetical protein BD310DRAFT_941299 [Dichomitus squalens]
MHGLSTRGRQRYRAAQRRCALARQPRRIQTRAPSPRPKRERDCLQRSRRPEFSGGLGCRPRGVARTWLIHAPSTGFQGGGVGLATPAASTVPPSPSLWTISMYERLCPIAPLTLSSRLPRARSGQAAGMDDGWSDVVPQMPDVTLPNPVPSVRGGGAAGKCVCERTPENGRAAERGSLRDGRRRRRRHGGGKWLFGHSTLTRGSAPCARARGSGGCCRARGYQNDGYEAWIHE